MTKLLYPAYYCKMQLVTTSSNDNEQQNAPHKMITKEEGIGKREPIYRKLKIGIATKLLRKT